MVVNAAQKNGVAAFGWEIGIGVFTFEYGYVGQVALGHFGTQFCEFISVNLGGEDFAGGTDYLRRGKGVLSVACANVGNDGSAPPFHYGGQAFDFIVGVGVGVGAVEYNRCG